MFLLVHEGGRAVRINISNIDKYLEYADGRTSIFLSNNRQTFVDETVEQLDKALGTINVPK